MNALKGIFLAIFSIAFFSILFPADIHANLISCNSDSASISPSTGDTSTSFTVSSDQGILVDNVGDSFTILVISPNNVIITSQTAIANNQNSDGLYSFTPVSFGGFDISGDYSVAIVDTSDNNPYCTVGNFSLDGDIDPDGSAVCGGLNEACCLLSNPDGLPECSEGVCLGGVCSLVELTEAPTCLAPGGYGFPTAIGCIPFQPTPFAIALSNYLTGIAGLISLILISYAAFLYMTSEGNPQRLGESKNIALAAITGLILVSLGILVFRFVAIDLLGLF